MKNPTRPRLKCLDPKSWGHGSVGRGKLAAGTLRALPGTPGVMPGRGEDGLAGGTHHGQQKNHPSGVRSVKALQPCRWERGFPVGCARAALVAAGGGGDGLFAGWSVPPVVWISVLGWGERPLRQQRGSGSGLCKRWCQRCGGFLGSCAVAGSARQRNKPDIDSCLLLVMISGLQSARHSSPVGFQQVLTFISLLRETC